MQLDWVTPGFQKHHLPLKANSGRYICYGQSWEAVRCGAGRQVWSGEAGVGAGRQVWGAGRQVWGGGEAGVGGGEAGVGGGQ